jgi:hypothetical protein
MPYFSHVAGLLIALLVGADQTGVPATAKLPDPRQPRQVRIAVSREKTFVTGPVAADGYIDYCAAVEERFREGVTVENNAVVALVKLFGPARIPREIRKAFFDGLGIPELPLNGYYLPGFRGEVSFPLPGAPPSLFAETKQASRRPWNGVGRPRVIRLLAEHDWFLNMLTTAVRRPRYYEPLFYSEGGKSNAPLLELENPILPCREIAEILAARAMLHIGRGQFDRAIEDTLTLHRLARLVGQYPTTLGVMFANLQYSLAIQCTYALLECDAVSQQQLEFFEKELRTLPPLPTVAESHFQFERLVALQALTAQARIEPDSKLLNSVDWNAVLRETNHIYDRFGAGKWRELRETIDEINKATTEIVEEQQPNREALIRRAKELDSGRLTEQGIMLQLSPPDIATVFVQKFMNSPTVSEADQRMEARTALLWTGLALAKYRRVNGRLPESLRELVPEYLAAVPADPFDDQPLRFRTLSNQIRLYSIAGNKIDDQGNQSEDTPEGDDIGLRFSIQAPSAPTPVAAADDSTQSTPVATPADNPSAEQPIPEQEKPSSQADATDRGTQDLPGSAWNWKNGVFVGSVMAVLVLMAFLLLKK